MTLLVDGTNVFYRFAWVWKSPQAATEGLTTLRQLRDSLEADRCYVVWDNGQPSFRHDQYPEYKVGRAPTPPEVASALRSAQEQCRSASFVSYVEAPGGFEADDVLATLARRFGECAILSNDSDLLQLLGPGRWIFRFGKEGLQTVVAQDVERDYGVEAAHIPDYKALVGDASDNIPGIRGIGPVFAKRLLSQFRTLPRLYDNLFRIPDPKLRSRLQGTRAQAQFWHDLCSLREDVPLAVA